MMAAMLNVPREKGAFDVFEGGSSKIIARDGRLHGQGEFTGAASPDHTIEPEAEATPASPADTTSPDGQRSPHSLVDTVMDGDGYSQRHAGQTDEEGIEVVLGEEGGPSESAAAAAAVPPSASSTATAARSTPDQNVFRPPRAARRPQAMRNYVLPTASPSYGYSGPPPSARPPPPTAPPLEYGAPPPYPVPYNPSRSFEEGSYGRPLPLPPPPLDHYSPHLEYPPPPGRGPAEDINVISPSHKSEHGYRPPPSSQRGRPSPPRPPGYYQYPPPSPVSRTEGGGGGGGGGGGHDNSPPRLRGYAPRGRELGGPYSAAGSQSIARRPDDERAWNPYPVTTVPSQDPGQPPVVATSFDSEPYSSRHSRSSHPTTPSTPYTHAGTPMHDPRYASTSYGTSFDSQTPPHAHAQPPPPHFDDTRYYGRQAHPPESPYSHYSYGYSGSYSYGDYSPHPDYHRSGARAYSRDESEAHASYYHGYPPPPHHPYPPHPGMHMQPAGGRKSSNSSSSSSSMLLPEAAREIDFDVTSPPMSPVLQPSDQPVCKSPADVNNNDVLCGRGGGTNSQIGNRMFRKLVQEFQPTYLLARRKEKPLLARTIVLIIRKRGGRFLKKNEETGELFEVGDQKAEAKTSQALREGLDVRATRSAAGGLLDKKKKKAASMAAKEERAAAAARQERYEASSVQSQSQQSQGQMQVQMHGQVEVTPLKSPPPTRAESPPSLPRLQGEERPEGYAASRPIVGAVHPPSPSNETLQFRKRRRMRSGDNSSAGCMPGFQDRLFPEFCPPRADLARGSATLADDSSVADTDRGVTSRSAERTRQGRVKSEGKEDDADDDDDDIRYQRESTKASGCANIALDIVTGAASGSFCLGPR